MSNLILAAIATALWGGAYGAYFAPVLRRWWRARRRRPVVIPPIPMPPRARSPRPRAMPVVLAPRPAPPPPRESNVITFPGRPRRPSERR